jgi:predicted component of type VI protein secretion system
MFALISPQHGHKHLSGTFLLTENSASWTVLQVSSSLEALSLPRLHKETSSVIGDLIVLVLVLVVAGWPRQHFSCLGHCQAK